MSHIAASSLALSWPFPPQSWEPKSDAEPSTSRGDETSRALVRGRVFPEVLRVFHVVLRVIEVVWIVFLLGFGCFKFGLSLRVDFAVRV